jgi:putative endonuclease
MHEVSYCTYIIASRSHTLYIGGTGDLLKPVFQHKWKEHEGFTARYNCDRLAWFERHQDVQRAIAREKELKGWRRSKKIALIWIPEKQPRILRRCAPQDDIAWRNGSDLGRPARTLFEVILTSRKTPHARR